MSTYYYFYIGYVDNKTKKVHAMGPFDDKGKLHEIFYRTGMSISEMYRSFKDVPYEDIEEKYQEKFSDTSWNDENKRISTLKMQYIDELPEGNYIKSGYFLIEDVKKYLDEDYCDWDDFDGFYQKVDPIVYAELVKQEAMFGKPEPKKDDDGYEIPVYSASDYMYFAYPDFHGQEYEAFMCREALHTVYDSYDFKYGDYKDRDITPVILCNIC